MPEFLARLVVGILPVILFLLGLIYFDSYKLVRMRWVLGTIALGGVVAGLTYLINVWLITNLNLDIRVYSRYIAPVIEELAKALVLVFLLRAHRIGFLVDAAIYGFAIGAGFALVENLYYLQSLPDSRFVVWLVRGCGTAIMHGGATAIFGIMAKGLSERDGVPVALAYVPGLMLAAIVHSVFNHFFLTPLLSTVGILIALPPLVVWIFERSEKSLARWINVGFDAHTELLELIESGGLSESKVGLYLTSLKERFRGEVVADLLCYLRLHVELSLRAKGLLMLRESGFRAEVDEETRAKFKELEFLEGSIGRTGKLAMAPFLQLSNQDLWQLYMLGK
jgi:RsiW-degrading membrane proteinase PrsW (M82 family)